MGKLEDDLHAALNEANSAVTARTKTIAEIVSQRDAANRAIAAAQIVREQHALAAATGDENAVAAVKRARAEKRDADAVLEDLAIAQPRAEQQLAAARKSVERAQHALGRHEAEGLMRKRLKTAEALGNARNPAPLSGLAV